MFDTFYEDYIDFKDYIRRILDPSDRNLAAENELVRDYSWTIKLSSLEKKTNGLLKENEHLKVETESYQRAIQLMATETSNKINKSVWKTVSNKRKKKRNANLVNDIDYLAVQLSNVYEPLDVNFHKENLNKHQLNQKH